MSMVNFYLRPFARRATKRDGRSLHVVHGISRIPAPLVAEEDIVLDAVEATKEELLEEIGQHMQSRHGLDGNEVTKALRCRESISSTGIGESVAVPHARVHDLPQIQTMYVRLSLGLPFGAPDGEPVRHVFVLLAPKQAAQAHLDVLKNVSRALSDARLRSVLHFSRSAVEVQWAFDQATRSQR